MLAIVSSTWLLDAPKVTPSFLAQCAKTLSGIDDKEYFEIDFVPVYKAFSLAFANC
jgi:hypothetical protein